MSTAAKRKEYTATGTAKDASGLWHVDATDIVAAKTDGDKQFKFLKPIIDHYVNDCYAVSPTGDSSYEVAGMKGRIANRNYFVDSNGDHKYDVAGSWTTMAQLSAIQQTWEYLFWL